MTRTFLTRNVTPQAARAEAPARAQVSPGQLPATQDIGWLMVNLGLVTLLLGVLPRLF